jgi:hypothetical protein
VQSEAQTDLLLRNRDTDAARVANIRKTAQGMMGKKKRPREVLDYMAKQAADFVRDVVAEYVQVAGLEQSALAIVGTGSFGSGELFPYSDIDVQLMTSNEGEENRVTPEHMEGILHNIRMRIRLANMQDSTGAWKNTLGWDLDQLTDKAYDPQTVVKQDRNKALANAGLLHATARGKRLAGELAGSYSAQGRADAKAKMNLDLYDYTRQGEWVMKNPASLNTGGKAFDFKFKYLTLPKIFLNVLAMYYGLTPLGSWARIDELVRKRVFSPEAGDNFKTYLDATAQIRMKYQFFYEKEGQDMISPTPNLVPHNQENYPKGYYVLTDDDREALKKAQAIQESVLVRSVMALHEKMQRDEELSDAAVI